MTKRTKRALFYAAVAAFLLLSYVIILYAQGYKYSFSEGKFLRTGAISLKVNTDARILLNDELQGETSFFNNSYQIDRLLPGSYKLTVQKDDYSFWQKTITVEEGFVIDFPAIMLLPEEGEEEQELFAEVAELFNNLEPAESPFILEKKTGKLFRENNDQREEIAQNVKGFALSENGNKLTWWTNNELWVLWLSDQNFQPFHRKGEKELITRVQLPIQNGTWFRDEDHVILELERLDSKNRPYSIYRIVEIDRRGGVNIVEL